MAEATTTGAGIARTPKQIAREHRKAARSRMWRTFRRSKMGMAGLVIVLVFVAVAVFAPVLADRSGLDVTKVDGPLSAPPSWQYPLGTDDAGRSVLTLVIWGSRVSLLVGMLAAGVTMFIGSTIGIVAGFRGGRWDGVLMFTTDAFLVLPWLALAITISAILGQSLAITVLVIGVTSWPWTARLVRSQTLSVRERPYVERARGLGAPDRHVIARHVLPNVFPVIFSQMILWIAIAILAESGLAFLGLAPPDRVSWGSLLEEAFDAGATTLGAWWWISAPGICIVLVVLGFTMIGTALEEIINPRLRSR